MKKLLNYVRSVLSKEIVILCVDREKSKYLRSIGAKKKFIFGSEWVINYVTEDDLAGFFIKLRDEGFLFSYDQHGWGPSDLFRYLRDKNLLNGHFMEIYWVGPSEYRIQKD